MNGRAVDVTWTRVADSTMFTANIELLHEAMIMLTHLENLQFGCYMYGAADRESYAMPCGCAIP